MAPAPHVIAMPIPSTGHIIPIVHLSKLLASSGFSISFLTPPSNTAHVSKLLGINHLDHHSANIKIITIPCDASFESRSWDDIRYHLRIIQNDLQSIVEPIIKKVVSNEAPVVCLLSDVYLGWMQDIADKIGVPRVAVWCSLASDFQVYYHSSKLLTSGHLPFKAPGHRASYDDIDNAIPGFPGKCPRYHRVSSPDDLPCPDITIPGLPPLAKNDFPSFLQIEDPSDIIFHYFINQVKRVHEAHMAVVNSFFEVEAPVYTAMQKEGNVRPLGPLFLLREKWEASQNSEEKPAAPAKKDECIEWLDNQPPSSVIYVAFGSCVPLGQAQVAALAKGLEASEQRFLWALLPLVPDSTAEERSERLPKGFAERTKGRGLVVDWAPQTLVLRHASVGGFVSHCGWNSVMESLTYGKPLIGFPLLADHLLICKLIADEWKVGLRLNSTEEGTPNSSDLEQSTRELMTGEVGKQLRKRAGELGVAAEKAVASDGSSHATLKCLIEDLKKRAHVSS